MKISVVLAHVSLVAMTFGRLWGGGEDIITAENYKEMERRYNGEWTYPSDPVASNVYEQVKKLYTGLSPFADFIGVRGGGMANDMDMPSFMPFVYFVSNHCSAISADWQTYETNEMVRFTTLSAIAYSGYDRLTNLAVRIVTQFDSDTNFCGWATIHFMIDPYGTPQEEFLAINYDVPVISNLLSIVRRRANEIGDDDVRIYCDDALSGAAKRDYLDEVEAGLWQ